MSFSVFGPTFAEMLDPSLLPEHAARALADCQDPLDPANLYAISWRRRTGEVPHRLLDERLTGVAAPILVLGGREFPTGSHKVGPAYSILMEKSLAGETHPGRDTLVFPSTGNFGIGGAWVGPRMGYRSLVVLPEEMSAERFEKIRDYGAEVIATPGSESNVKEIYDRVAELRREPANRILNQFEELANYRFHYHVTGETAAALVERMAAEGIGNGRAAAFVSAMGSAGTIAAGDRLKERYPGCQIVGLEPVQCSTLYDVGFGSHGIEGIGDKHVTWIHNVMNMDWLLCVDDLECLKGLQLLEEGADTLAGELGLEDAEAEALRGFFGISGVCNVLGAIRSARVLGLGREDLVVTIATDGFDRYPSVLRRLEREHGRMDAGEAKRRIDIFHRQKLDYVLEGTRAVRRRWHNQKYFTWVEQQGKSIDALRELEDQAFWQRERAKIADIDRAWKEIRDS